jgi:hypothetical protein
MAPVPYLHGYKQLSGNEINSHAEKREILCSFCNLKIQHRLRKLALEATCDRKHA